MKSKLRDNGFTLMELMISILVLGILVAIALPLYRDYVIRAKVAEGVGLAGTAKYAVDEYYAAYTTLPSSNTQAGILTDIVGASTLTSNIQIGANGVITITFGSDSGVENKTLLLTPTASSTSKGLTWSCTDNTATLENKYRPASCR